MADISLYENKKYKQIYNELENSCWVFPFTYKSYPRRWHHYPEFFYSEQDHVLFEVNGVSYEVNKGEILFVWPGEPHAIIDCPESDKALILQFDSDLILSRQDFQRYAHLFYQMRVLRKNTHGELLEKLSEIFKEIFRIRKEKVPLYEMRSCMLLYEFFIELWVGIHVQTGESDSVSVKETETRRRMADICNYISTNCTEDLTLESVSEKAGFSKCYFSRLFKNYTGQSFPDYLSKERLRIAETLLLDPERSITDVCQEAGFNSIATFNRVFYKFKNANPTDFRKLYTKGEGHFRMVHGKG